MLGRIEKRELKNATGVKMLKETTPHYHLNLACVQAVCPTFVPSTLVIPSDVRKKLTPTRVASFGDIGLQI
jgi:hypothetical protein